MKKLADLLQPNDGLSMRLTRADGSSQEVAKPTRAQKLKAWFARWGAGDAQIQEVPDAP